MLSRVVYRGLDNTITMTRYCMKALMGPTLSFKTNDTINVHKYASLIRASIVATSHGITPLNDAA